MYNLQVLAPVDYISAILANQKSYQSWQASASALQVTYLNISTDSVMNN